MQAVNNVSSNTFLEYFMLTTIFETLAQVWFIPSIGFNSNYYHTNAKILKNMGKLVKNGFGIVSRLFCRF